ncbi:MAG: hypothetical protein WBL23_08475 [Salinisphaera sp.]
MPPERKLQDHQVGPFELTDLAGDIGRAAAVLAGMALLGERREAVRVRPARIVPRAFDRIEALGV